MPELAELTFHSLAEEFLRRFRRRECTIEQFALEYPEYSKLILEEFPALVMAEQLKSSLTMSQRSVTPPKVIFDYQLGKQIGCGGMGLVFAARHVHTGVDVAIKLLPLEQLRSNSSLQRFLIEAKTCQELNHPGIVPVYAYGTEGDFAFLAMRYVKGICLDQLVEKLNNRYANPDQPHNMLDWNVIATLAEQITSALQYAHDRGVVHRDIKPANLLIDHSGKICILDFGVAKVKANDVRLSRTGDIIGTPRYMAPEQIRGASDARCDIYALGVTLYELATGSLVWRSLTFKQLMTQRASMELPHIKDLIATIPDDLASIIMKACALHPENRYQSALEMGNDLSAFLTGTTMSPVEDSPRDDLPMSKPRGYLYAAAVILLTAGVSSYFGFKYL